jgi:hypothetical protein
MRSWNRFFPAAATAFAVVTAVSGGASATPAATRIDGTNFAIEILPGACKVNTECKVTLRLIAGNNFHVNEKFPYRFTGGEGVAWAKPLFSRESGDFHEEGQSAGVLVVAFTPAKAGRMSATGIFKLSVCSSSNCQVEKQEVKFEVDVAH